MKQTYKAHKVILKSSREKENAVGWLETKEKITVGGYEENTKPRCRRNDVTPTRRCERSRDAETDNSTLIRQDYFIRLTSFQSGELQKADAAGFVMKSEMRMQEQLTWRWTRKYKRGNLNLNEKMWDSQL